MRAEDMVYEIRKLAPNLSDSALYEIVEHIERKYLINPLTHKVVPIDDEFLVVVDDEKLPSGIYAEDDGCFRPVVYFRKPKDVDEIDHQDTLWQFKEDKGSHKKLGIYDKSTHKVVPIGQGECPDYNPCDKMSDGWELFGPSKKKLVPLSDITVGREDLELVIRLADIGAMHVEGDKDEEPSSVLINRLSQALKEQGGVMYPTAEEIYGKYRNPNKRCSYTFEADPLGYCWGYANAVDNNRAGEYTKESCPQCSMWKALKERSEG